MSEASRSLTRRGGTSWWSAFRRELVAEPAGYFAGSFVTGFATTLAFAAAPYTTLGHVMVIYLLGAVLIATRYGVAVSSFTVITSALCFDYFNIPPIFAFALPDAHGVLTFCGMLVTTIVVCSLLQRLRYQRTAARASEARTLALCELSLDLSETHVVSELPRVAERHLVCLFGAATRVLVRPSGDELLDASSAGAEREAAHAALEARELRVLERDEFAVGYQPVTSGHETLGLIVVELSRADSRHEHEQRLLLAACADRIAVAIERLALGDVARRAQVDAEAEHLRNELLSAMSHDLRTPLASILAAGTTLLGRGAGADPGRDELLETIVDETERLNRLVTNLLSVTRLESGKVRLNKEHEAFDELIASVLSRLAGRLEGRSVEVVCPPDLPLVSMDSVLVDQVLVNLIENVLRYTPAGSPLAISVETTESEVKLAVADRGPGIADDEREKVFEKFYRGAQAKRKDGGSGLGLTICRAVARAHGGRIEIKPRAGGGTTVEFTLPLSASSQGERGIASSPYYVEVHA